MKRTSRIRPWMAIVAVVAPVLVVMEMPVAADVVELKTGERIEGKLQSVSPDGGVVIETGGRMVRLDRSGVAAVFFGEAPVSRAALRAARDAVRALGAVHAVVMQSVAYPDYATAVAGAAAVVDGYLREPERGDAELRSTVRNVLALYLLGERAWRAISEQRDYAAVGRDPVIAQCPPLTRLLAESREKEGYLWGRGRGSDPATTAGIVIAARGVNPIWACAADKLGVAYQLLEAQHWGEAPSSGARP